MKLVVECGNCYETDFEMDEYGLTAKCKKCGREIFIRGLDISIVPDKDNK